MNNKVKSYTSIVIFLTRIILCTGIYDCKDILDESDCVSDCLCIWNNNTGICMIYLPEYANKSDYLYNETIDCENYREYYDNITGVIPYVVYAIIAIDFCYFVVIFYLWIEDTEFYYKFKDSCYYCNNQHQHSEHV